MQCVKTVFTVLAVSENKVTEEALLKFQAL